MMTAIFFLFVTAHSPPLPPVNCSHNPAVLSYHMHILYDVLDKSQVAAALSFRDDARKQFEGLTGPDAQCALDHDTCRYDQGRLAFIDDHALDNITADAGGPFVSGEWSMFVPVPYFGTITAWFMQHYTDRHPAFSLLMHGNTGCEYEDHTKWALWAGPQWPISTQVFEKGRQTSEFGYARGDAGNPVCLKSGAPCADAAHVPVAPCCAKLACSCATANAGRESGSGCICASHAFAKK